MKGSTHKFPSSSLPPNHPAFISLHYPIVHPSREFTSFWLWAMMLWAILLALLPAHDTILPLASISRFPSSPTKAAIHYGTPNFFAAASAPPNLDGFPEEPGSRRDDRAEPGGVEEQETPSGSIQTKENRRPAAAEEENGEGIGRELDETTINAVPGIQEAIESEDGRQHGEEQQERKQEQHERLSGGTGLHQEGQAKGTDEYSGRGGDGDKDGIEEHEEENPMLLAGKGESNIETGAWEEQLGKDAHSGESVQQSVDDKDMEALRAQTAEEANLKNEGGDDKAFTDHKEVLQQQQQQQQDDDELAKLNKNEGEGTSETIAGLPLEDQGESMLEQDNELQLPKPESRTLEEDVWQELETMIMHPGATFSEEMNQEPQYEQEKENTELEQTVLPTEDELAEGNDQDTLAAQQLQSEGELTPDKKEGEEAEEEALREANVDEGEVGEERATIQKEQLNDTKDGGAGIREEGEKEQAGKEASLGRRKARREKKKRGTLKQHQKEAREQVQPRANGVLQEFKKLNSSLDSLAQRFEDQQKQLQKKHLAGQMEKQEQILNENEAHVRSLLEKQKKLLSRWKTHWERMLHAGNRRAGFMRGAAVHAGPSREQLMQHQHTERLTDAFSEAANRFGETIRQASDCCSAFVKDHERALQVIYEYRRVLDLLEMGVRINKLSKKEVHERLRACSEAFSVLSQLLITFDKRVASIVGLTGALQATQALSLARLKQVIEAQEQEGADVTVADGVAGIAVKGETVKTTRPVEDERTLRDGEQSTEAARKKGKQQLAPRSEVLQNEQKQLLEAARRAFNTLERLSNSVAETTRSVINARSMWMQELSTQLLRHFDFLLKAGKQLRLRESQNRQRRKSTEKKQRTGGKADQQASSNEIEGKTKSAEHEQGKRRDSQTSVDLKKKTEDVPEKDAAYEDTEEEVDEYDEGLLQSASRLGMQRIPEKVQQRSTSLIGNRAEDVFRRHAEQLAGQNLGRGETQFLDDVNIAGWKAIQEMAEGAKATSRIARDTREALEKEIQTDTTTVVLGILLGVVLLFLLALIIYGYHMVFSYEEEINSYKIGNRAGQAVEKDEAKATVGKSVSAAGGVGKRFG